MLPPPQPTVPSTRKTAIVASTPPNARCLGRRIKSRFAPRASKSSKKAPAARAGTERKPVNGIERGAKESGSVAALPLVIIVTVNGAAFPFEICSEDGP